MRYSPSYAVRFLMRCPLRLLPLIVIAGLAAACGETKPSRFYLLSTIPPVDAKPATTRGGTTLSVGPIELPKYADRPQIVTVAEPTTLELAEYDRWGEPLAENFARVMVEHLQRMTTASRVEVYPFPASSRDPRGRQLVVQVLRFHTTSTGDVELAANWSILDQEGRRTLASGTSFVSDQASPGDYPAITVAMSRAVAAFSKEVATAYNASLGR